MIDFEELLYRNKEIEESAITVAVCFGTEAQQKARLGDVFVDADFTKLNFLQSGCRSSVC